MQRTCEQGTGFSCDQSDARMSYTLLQLACESLRDPAVSYKHWSCRIQIVYPVSSYYAA